MSFHLEITLSYPVEDLIQQFSSGNVGPVSLGPVTEFDPKTWRADWAYGEIFFDSLTSEPDRKEIFEEEFGLPPTLQSRLWITTKPYYEGQLAAYALTAHLLRNHPGDMALIFHGETVMAQRVNGHLKLRVDQMNEDILPLFDGLSYEPLSNPGKKV